MTMERPALLTDVYGFPLAAAGTLPSGAFGIEHPTRPAYPAPEDPDALAYTHLDYGYVTSYMCTRDTRDTERTERQAVALGCEAILNLEHGDTFTYPYIVTLTGTVGHPGLETWVQWVGLTHLVGNVFHAVGWLPWEKDAADEPRTMSWGVPAVPRTEPRIDLAVPQQVTTTGNE